MHVLILQESLGHCNVFAHSPKSYVFLYRFLLTFFKTKELRKDNGIWIGAKDLGKISMRDPGVMKAVMGLHNGEGIKSRPNLKVVPNR